jgi:hypothetical protein
MPNMRPWIEVVEAVAAEKGISVSAAVLSAARGADIEERDVLVRLGNLRRHLRHLARLQWATRPVAAPGVMPSPGTASLALALDEAIMSWRAHMHALTILAGWLWPEADSRRVRPERAGDPPGDAGDDGGDPPQAALCMIGSEIGPWPAPEFMSSPAAVSGVGSALAVETTPGTPAAGDPPGDAGDDGGAPSPDAEGPARGDPPDEDPGAGTPPPPPSAGTPPPSPGDPLPGMGPVHTGDPVPEMFHTGDPVPEMFHTGDPVPGDEPPFHGDETPLGEELDGGFGDVDWLSTEGGE